MTAKSAGPLRLPTGLDALDRATGGGGAGALWAISGPSGVGKSLLVLGVARAAALRAGVPVRWLSTNDEPEALIEGVLAAEGRLPIQGVRDGDLNDEQQDRLTRLQAEVQRAPLNFASVSPEGFLPAATAASTGGDLGVLVLDDVPDLWESGVLADLKRLAAESSTWVVVVVPDLGTRAARRAVGSGADTYLWLERDDLHEPDHPRVGEADISITRSGHPRSTTITVAYQSRYARFVDITTS